MVPALIATVSASTGEGAGRPAVAGELRRQALEHRVDRGGHAVQPPVRHMGEVSADDRGMSEVVEKAMGARGQGRETREALLAVAGGLVDRARAHGAIGEDVTTGDVNMVICGLAAVIRNGAGDWRRYIEVALDGSVPVDFGL
ncbi:hypothetical protein [Spongiactinospora sp. TRM90649]|uniref:SbtR family transcriptional regulator n=1 Tax=Spongiactinospora sp. TRM90649 TaxID=3031114 RepID=UPI0023F8A924|nr:hypothetical protein [Spongiactinospora sp. TRM90649]MDF5751880.1 hypothetical protein [Spongiactinospora sp. TRM90649]